MKRLFPFFLLLALLITSGAGCGGSSVAEEAANTPVKLTIWRVFDDDDTFRGLMDDYRAIHPNISFEYRELRFDEYEEELIRALAEGNGPDIFSIPNTWIGKYESLILPMPDTLTIPYTEVKGSIKKEEITTLVESATMSKRELETTFVDVVVDDVLRTYQPTLKDEPEEKIFALPLFVDTLALFYNKDLLDAAGIAQPAVDWETFQNDVAKMTLLGAGDEILQSGAALGTSANVDRSFDILSLLMMQNGTDMVNDRGDAAFAGQGEEVNYGLDALYFYADFANPTKQVYCWNKDLPSSFDAFVSGQVAYFFGYSYHIPLVEAANSKLDFGVTTMPQIAGGRAVNYAHYWVETVSKDTRNANWAWDFILFATDADGVESYLEASGRPTALRALMGNQLEDEWLSPFVSQLLTSESWYKGDDVEVAEEAFADLIEAAVEGNEDVTRLIRDAQNQVNETL